MVIWLTIFQLDICQAKPDPALQDIYWYYWYLFEIGIYVLLPSSY